MENDAATLYCPNESCQAANPLTHKFCQRCSTPLPKRYLWVVGDSVSVGSPGEIIGDRYLVIDKSVLFDTKPALLPQAPELENSQILRPYLRLIPYRLNVPQIYGVIPYTDGTNRGEILLLEKPAIFLDNVTQQIQLCSELTTAWRNATSMRQLNWLWQIANLWQPLKSEGVASSLLNSHLLRVEGSLVRLLELSPDGAKTPELPQLGEFWQQLHQTAKPAVAEFVHHISNSLIQGEIKSVEVLIDVIDQALADLGKSQTSTIQIATKTDTGPSRQRNEDACYPPSGTLLSKPPQTTALAIVCDGIGGHEGGNVASNLAIETIHQQVQQLTKVPVDHIDPSLLITDLERAVAVANDKISQRNDSENRQGRKRMGTTLVMALPMGHEMYITHVGDSRAYWITRHGCYQVTLDDDVASREVRLGYAIYREAVQQSGAGSLVQALGMSPSSSLHPTAQRFIVDEEGIFLLTSDGLSDFDRVEDYWETEILPVITGENTIVNTVDKLIEIANTKNGHDNVTIALVHSQVKYKEPESPVKAVIPDTPTSKTLNLSAKEPQSTLLQSAGNQKNTQITTAVPSTPPKNTSNWLNWVTPLVLVVAAGSLGYLYRFFTTQNTPAINPKEIKTTEPPTNVTVPRQRSLDNLQSGWIIKTNSEIPLNKEQKLRPESFLEVLGKKVNNQSVAGDYELELQLCNNTNSPNPENNRVTIELAQLKKYSVDVLNPNQPNPCQTNFTPSDTAPPGANPPNNPSATEPKTR